MIITYDTEFVDNGHTIELLSIGLVTAEGEKLYRVVEDANWSAAKKIPWMVDNVLAKMPMSADAWWSLSFDESHPDYAAIATKATVGKHVEEFLLSHGGPDEVDLWAYYPATDHVALYQLFGSMINCTKHGVPMRTSCLKQQEVQMDIWHQMMFGRKSLEQFHERRGPRPVQDPATEHHALHDAEHDMDLARWLRVVPE